MNRKVIIQIFAHKPTLQWYEQISLEQCSRVLGRHPIRLVCPTGLDVSAYRRIAPALEVDFIPSHWLASSRAYNRLKILPFLYERYAAYEFLLTYELDAFVFKDELEEWCEQGWDYIGAPWFEGYANATPSSRPIGVGNGGFSLRRISTMLRITRSRRAIRPMLNVYSEWRSCTDRSPRGLWRLLGNLIWRNCFHHLQIAFWPALFHLHLNRFSWGEDIFWSCAGDRIAGFRLAPYHVARHFSFEVNPERLFIECGNKLPFGCHKWTEYQPGFWKPLIEAEGYRWLAAGSNAAENVEADALNRSRTAAAADRLN
jgi:hypothetical protein